MAASAGYPIFTLNGPDGVFNLVLLVVNRLWVVGVTLILYGTPQKIVQRGQIAAARRPVDIAVSADYAITYRAKDRL